MAQTPTPAPGVRAAKTPFLFEGPRRTPSPPLQMPSFQVHAPRESFEEKKGTQREPPPCARGGRISRTASPRRQTGSAQIPLAPGAGPCPGLPGPRLGRRKGKKRKNRGQRRGGAEEKLSGVENGTAGRGERKLPGLMGASPLRSDDVSAQAAVEAPSSRPTHFEPLCSGGPRTPRWRLRPQQGCCVRVVPTVRRRLPYPSGSP